jgi:hypothetical protein
MLSAHRHRNLESLTAAQFFVTGEKKSGEPQKR